MVGLLSWVRLIGLGRNAGDRDFGSVVSSCMTGNLRLPKRKSGNGNGSGSGTSRKAAVAKRKKALLA